MIELRKKLKQEDMKKFKKIGRDPVGSVKNKNLIDYWNGLGLHSTKTYTKATKNASLKILRATRGTLYQNNELFADYSDKRFTEEEIKMSMFRFSLAAFKDEYLPIDKSRFQKMPLDDFLLSPYAKIKMTKSLFLFFHENPPKKIIIDENPSLTEKITKLYCKKILMDEQAEVNSSTKTCFTIAGNKLTAFLESNKKNFRVYSKITNIVAAEWLFNSIVNDSGETVLPSYFASDKTFLNRLPNYLKKIGVFTNGF